MKARRTAYGYLCVEQPKAALGIVVDTYGQLNVIEEVAERMSARLLDSFGGVRHAADDPAPEWDTLLKALRERPVTYVIVASRDVLSDEPIVQAFMEAQTTDAGAVLLVEDEEDRPRTEEDK